jgi:hypothetical protein
MWLNDNDYFQLALGKFNGGPGWYSWKKLDDAGNKIPNNQRMTYENIIIIKDGAVLPSKSDVETKQNEIKEKYEVTIPAQKESGKSKLKSGDALTDAEISALFGV